MSRPGSNCTNTAAIIQCAGNVIMELIARLCRRRQPPNDIFFINLPNHDEQATKLVQTPEEKKRSSKQLATPLLV